MNKEVMGYYNRKEPDSDCYQLAKDICINEGLSDKTARDLALLIQRTVKDFLDNAFEEREP